MRLSDSELLTRAKSGDEDAWRAICDRYLRLVWSIPLASGLSNIDAADVVQLTWSRLVASIDSLRDPGQLKYWLQTTARRESWRVAKMRSRSVPVGPENWMLEADRRTPRVDGTMETVLEGIPDPHLAEALHHLGIDCRTLVLMLADDPPATYEAVADTFNVSVGTIGAKRRRCLDQLRALYERAVAREEASWRITAKTA